MFSFVRLSGADPRLGVEMQSTGEVACFGRNPYEAYYKAVLAGGLKLPPGGVRNVLLSLGSKGDKAEFLPYVRVLLEMGSTIYATAGTASALKSGLTPAEGERVIQVFSALTSKEPNVSALLAAKPKKIDLAVNTPSSRDSAGVTAGYHLRRKAMDSAVALIVNLRQAMLLVETLHTKQRADGGLQGFSETESWHGYHTVA